MSVINKMLKELDQRQASPAPGGPAVRPTRAGVEAGKGKETFWRLLAFLMLASVVWIVVVVYKSQMQPVVTSLAYKAAEDANLRRAQTPPPSAPIAAIQVVPDRGTALPPVNPEALRLAPSIETRIPSEPASRPLVAPGRTNVFTAPVLPKETGTPEGRALQSSERLAGPAEVKVNQGRVEKGNRPRTPQEFAEAEFRRGAGLLNDGRVGEAQEVFAAALNADQRHESARQALIALLLDQRKIEQARRLLQDGLAINPANAVFAPSLARILIEAGEYDGALKALQGASAAGASSAEYQALAGAAYQRLGNHRLAMEAYQAALRIYPDSGASWIGLAISLDALNHSREAAEAYRRALTTESLTPDLRAFAETSLLRQK